MAPPTHTIPPHPSHTHTHTIIFLHGRDSTARAFAAELFESETSAPAAARIAGPGPGPPTRRTLPALFPTVRWVFPCAPVLPSARFGAPMSQWFDMWSVEDPGERSGLQAAGIRESIALVREVVRAEERAVPRGRIFLAGVSQGFAAVLAAALADDARGGYAGLVGWCGWMPGFEDGARGGEVTPVFLAHARDDGVVPVVNGRGLRSTLDGLGYDVEWHEYEEGGHWINEPQGMDDMALFIQRRMRAQE